MTDMTEFVLEDHPYQQTRLAYPDERLALTDPRSADGVEEMRSLEIEREHDVGAGRWQGLGWRQSRSEIMLPRAHVDERLITEGLHEIETRCGGSRRNPWACDY